MEWLKKRIGPFPVGLWLIIGAGGIGLGLLLRKNFGGSEESEGASGVTLDYSEAGTGGFFAIPGGGVIPKDPFPTPQDGTVTPTIQAQIDSLTIRIAGLTGEIANLTKQIAKAKNPAVKARLRAARSKVIAEKANLVAQRAALRKRL